MKLVCLNIWGGTIYGPLMEYLGKLSGSADIFCFQEAFSALPGAPKESSGARMFLFNELESLLPEFRGFFDTRSMGYDYNSSVGFPVSHGLAIFARKNLSVLSYRAEILEQAGNVDDPVEGWTKAQTLTVATGGKRSSLINYHGVAQPGNKLDTPQRISHAKKLRLIWDSLAAPAKILCGDFNMYPDIESIKILEGAGKNLIKQFGIQSTRNEVSHKKHPGSKQYFADYAFVSPEVKVTLFEVPYNEVSDHLPLILEFSL